jgi:FtsH-binding integral membrane protein
MTGPDGGSATRAEHQRRRMRQTWRLLGAGLTVALLAAAVTGLVGLPGQVGAVSFLLVAALACAVTGVVALLTSMIDDLKDRGVGRRRPILGGVLLFVAFLLIGMVMGVAGG